MNGHISHLLKEYINMQEFTEEPRTTPKSLYASVKSIIHDSTIIQGLGKNGIYCTGEFQGKKTANQKNTKACLTFFKDVFMENYSKKTKKPISEWEEKS